MQFKKNKGKILIFAFILIMLAASFYFGGNSPDSIGWEVPEDTQYSVPAGNITMSEASYADKISAAPKPSTSAPAKNEQPDEPAQQATEQTAATEQTTGQEYIDKPTTEANKDSSASAPVSTGNPQPVEPEDVTIGSTAYTCTLSINCGTILDNMEHCDPAKAALIPDDGWILHPVTVTFYEGESVFNVLQRVCKQQKIHMEFENTPIYNSAYIEGINNIYEFDIGELSGWMYKVNDWFPNYGSSRYAVKDGDVIEWVYTCDMGHDVGGGYSTGNGRGE